MTTTSASPRSRPALTPPAVSPDVEAGAAALVDAVRAVVHALRGTSRSAEQEIGVHGAELLVLRKLVDEPCASLAELAVRTQTDPSTASVVVRGLVERGLLTRSVAPDDRRRTPIAITVAGRQLLRRAPEPAHARVARAAGPLDAAALQELARQLSEVAGRLAVDRDGAAAEGAAPDDGSPANAAGASVAAGGFDPSA
ncbi:MAG TPA: MarR family transcriptional regulator [Gemmatirosa sp.]